MELQLGLALSSSLAKGRFDFDLNQDYHENSTNDRKYRLDEQGKNMNKYFLKKRKIDVKDDDFAIGWPPVKSWRQSCSGRPANYVNVKNSGGGGCHGGGYASNSLFVKVKMEGVGIARKIDLNNHHSCLTLVPNLLGMFGKCGEDVGKYNLMYQDKEGDWMLAGDVPLLTFVKSVRCLKLIKKERIVRDIIS